MNVYADMRWPAKTGIGLVKTAIASRLPRDAELHALPIASRIGSPISTIDVARSLARQPIPIEGPNLFWSAGFVPPAWSAIPRLITIHDLTHLHYYSKFHAAYYNWVLRPLYQRCEAIICVSDYTKREFLEWSRVDPERVTTVHNGIDAAQFAEPHRSGFDFPYVFYAGNHRSYKNLDRLIEAYAGSSLVGDGVHLLLTGNPDPGLRDIANRFGVGEKLKFAGRVDDRQLVGLYRDARMVAYVSLYEGFGLPILEAMAAGVPVMTSNVSAMPEISGEAAHLVDPRSIDQMVHGLNRLQHDDSLRAALIARGRTRVADFDWNATAAAYHTLMRQTSR